MATTYEPMTGLAITNKAAHVMLPSNTYGTLSVNELKGTDTEASTTYTFPNGLNGVTVTNSTNEAATGGTDDTNSSLLYVAFNNSIFSNAEVAGQRYVIGPNTSMSFVFNDVPKPTQMTLRIDAVLQTAFFIAAEA